MERIKRAIFVKPPAKFVSLRDKKVKQIIDAYVKKFEPFDKQIMVELNADSKEQIAKDTFTKISRLNWGMTQTQYQRLVKAKLKEASELMSVKADSIGKLQTILRKARAVNKSHLNAMTKASEIVGKRLVYYVLTRGGFKGAHARKYSSENAMNEKWIAFKEGDQHTRDRLEFVVGSLTQIMRDYNTQYPYMGRRKIILSHSKRWFSHELSAPLSNFTLQLEKIQQNKKFH